MVEITRDNYKDYKKNFWKNISENEVVTWNGIALPCFSVKNIFLEAGENEIPGMLDICGMLEGDVYISRSGVKALSKYMICLEDAREISERYRLCGECDITPNGNIITEDIMRDMFTSNTRFRGRTPRILPQMASLSDRYGISPETIYERFNLKNYQLLQNKGHLPKAEVILCGTFLSEAQILKVCENSEILSMVSHLLVKSNEKRKDHYMFAALFIADHTQSDIGVLRSVYENPGKFDIDKHTTLDAVLSKDSRLKAEKEVEKVEKAYKKPGFKLKDCKCLLRDNPTDYKKYRGRILDGKDPLQVMLGKLTCCCQKLGDAGESAMMYGLINDHAGFWVLEDIKSGKIYAQAESWEYDSDTLVFDNIEFANDAEIDQYREPIAKYLLNSPYKTVIMGCGYNNLSYEAGDALEAAPDVVPSITPRDAYIMSYEKDMWIPDNKDEDKICNISSENKAKELLDDGYITYYDYLYSDVDDNKGTFYLKKDGVVPDYFLDSLPEEERNNNFSHIDMDRFMQMSKIICKYLKEGKEFDNDSVEKV